MSEDIESLNRDSINESMYTVRDRAKDERSEMKESIRDYNTLSGFPYLNTLARFSRYLIGTEEEGYN